VPQSQIFRIGKEVKINDTKLKALLASLRDSCVDVSLNLPEQVEITGLCGEDILSTWSDIQHCFKVFSETVVVTNDQLVKWQKKFHEKASSLSCQIVVSKMPQHNNAYESIIKGFTRKNVKELVDFVQSKCMVQEEVIFKDFCAGSIMCKNQYSQWKKYGQSKRVTVSQTKEGLGFLVKGNPKEVDDVILTMLEKYDCILDGDKHISYGQVELKSLYQQVCTSKRLSNWKKQAACKFMGECTFHFTSPDQVKDDCIGRAFLRVGKDHVVAVNVVNKNLNVEKTDAIVVPTDRCHEEYSYPIQLPSLKEESFDNDFANFLISKEALQEIGSTEVLDYECMPCTRVIHIVYPEADMNNGGIPDLVQKSLLFASDIRVGSISFPDINPQMINPLIDSLISLQSPTIHTVRLAVSGKDRAKRYAKVLESKVSSSLTSSDTDKKTKSYSWSWKDDYGVAVFYDPVSTDLLNQAYEKDPLGTCDLQIGHQCYKVDFHTMKQCNVCSLFERDVTKSLSKGRAKSLITWKYRDDLGNFSAYLPKYSVQIEAMFHGRASSTLLDINTRSYFFDFTAMLQVNAETGHSREIDRVVPHSDSANKSTKPEFLCKNEVIVNFKSPTEHFQSLKAYMHQGLNELFTSDDISLPFDDLPDYIEAIISKHPKVDCEVTTAGPTQGKRTVLRVTGTGEHVQKAQNELQKAIINAFSPKSLPFSSQKETQYPCLWDTMATGEDCKIVSLDSASDEYSQVLEKFTETMARYTVLDIRRIQNKWIWERFAMTKCRMDEKNCGRINELELFHGSRTAPAERICKSEEGFDMRFSREGLWGQANYFAKDSRYSDSYAYSCNGVKEMMLAQVLTGYSYECMPDRSLRMPPLKKANETDQSKVLHRYDSVCGVTNNCKVYMTYCNENAYPAYVIQYTDAATGGHSNNAQKASNYTHVQAKSATRQSHGRKVPVQASSRPNAATNLTQGQHQATSRPNAASNLVPQATSRPNTSTNLAQGQPQVLSQSNVATNRGQPQALSQPNVATNFQGLPQTPSRPNVVPHAASPPQPTQSAQQAHNYATPRKSVKTKESCNIS